MCLLVVTKGSPERVKNTNYFMNDALRVGKKAFTLVVAFATIFSMVGFSAFVAPLTASASTDLSAGDLIVGETLSTVYYYGSDSQRYAFPNEKTFFSWYDNFDGVVSITDDELADITMAGNVVYRPGTNWIKVTSIDTVYVVSTDGAIHPILDEATAEALGGTEWNTMIHDVPDVYFADYTVGAELASDTDVVDGMLVADGDAYYLVWGGEARLITDGLTANGLDSAFALGADISALTAGTEVTSELANVTDTAQLITEETVTEMTEVTVSLGSDSPSAMTLATGTDTTVDLNGFAHLVSYTFDNPTSEELSVTSFAVTRGGVSSDSTMANIYLFDGYDRLTDSATLSSGKATWNDTTGLFTIPANSSASVDVWVDLLYGTSGQTLNLSIAATSDIAFDGDYEAAGSFPLESATHSIATVSNLGYLNFNTTTTPSSDGAPNPQNDFNVWQNVVTVGNNEVELFNLSFRNIGSIDSSDIENFRLYIDGVMQGDAVANQDENGYIDFDLSDSPVRLTTGSRTIKLIADIIGGSTRTVSISLRNAADVLAFDEDYDTAVIPQANSTSFSARSANEQIIAAGYVTITKATETPSGNITMNGSGTELGIWDVKAYGEDMKIENFDFYVDWTGDTTNNEMQLRNGAVYADGSQIGSTTDIEEDDDGTTTTLYTFGSSLVVGAGETVQLSINADIYDNDSAGTDEFAADDTLQVTLATGDLNVLRMTSGSYVTYPSGDVDANVLTLKEGTVSVSEYTAYGDQDTVDNKTAYKVGAFTVSSSTTETINVNTFSVDLTGSGFTVADEISDLYIEYGPADSLTTSTIKNTTTATNNDFSVDYALEAGEDIYVNVYATMTGDTGLVATDTLIASLEVSGTGSDSSSAITGTLTTGQTITIQDGVFAAALDGTSPLEAILSGDQTVELAKFRLTSSYQDYYIQEFVVDTASAGSASTAYLYDGEDLLSTALFTESSSTRARFYLSDFHIPSSSYKTLTVKVALNDVGPGYSAYRQDAKLTLKEVRYIDTTGSICQGDTVAGTCTARTIDGNSEYVYSSIPVLTHVDLTNSTVINGSSTELYKFTVSAADSGSIAIKQFNFTAALSDATGATDSMTVDNWKLYKNGTDITATVSITDQAAFTIEGSAGKFREDDTGIRVHWAAGEDVIAAGESVTYSLKATPNGFNVTDAHASPTDYFTMYLGVGAGEAAMMTAGTDDHAFYHATSGWGLADAADGTNATYTYNFIWSDMSATAHNAATTTATADWTAGYLVLNLDLDSETWEN
jgi:hypothetical protein